MKKFLRRLFRQVFFLAFFLLSKPAFSQYEIWGSTPNGGAYGKGVIFKHSNNAIEAIHDFNSPHAGRAPSNVKLLKASNSKLYGTTMYGGTRNSGVIFEYTPGTQEYKVVYHFANQNGNSGYLPMGSLMEASNGKLYGTAMGGTNGAGVLFEFDITTNIYQVVVNFDVSTGSGANVQILVEGDDAKLYGTASASGGNDGGLIFEYDLVTETYSKKVEYSADKGSVPYGGLMRASNGKFYGMNRGGGLNSSGTLFEYDITTNTLLVKKHFGANPDGSFVSGAYAEGFLTEHSNGKLYGSTSKGGIWGAGVIFEWDLVTNTVIQKAEFGANTINAANPGSLLLASDGNFYGVTFDDGVTGSLGGLIFEFNPTANTFGLKHLIHSSRCILTEFTNGMLYGVTIEGGNTFGDLFQYDLVNDEVTSLFNFDDAPEGARSYGKLTQAFNGKLYGTAYEGGPDINGGTIFEVDPETRLFTNKIYFSPFRGPEKPKGGFTLHPNGKLYGTTTFGGPVSGYGAIVEFDPASSSITDTLYLEDGAGVIKDGQKPLGELTLAYNGKYYGLASGGGNNLAGTLFEYDPFAHTLSKKINFGGASGSVPKGSLTLGSDGILYGVTSAGGDAGFGILFSFDPATGMLTKRADFTSGIGVNPEGKMTEVNGAFYGFAFNGGTGVGTIYQYTMATAILTSVHNFFINGVDGFRPMGGELVEFPNGKLYGMIKHGGANGLGVMLEFDPATNTATTIHSFDGVAGASPEYSSPMVMKQSQEITANTSSIIKNFGDASFALTATTSSGLPVFYVSSDPAVASVDNNSILIKGAGEVTIYILQNGDRSYLAAPMKQMTLTINKAALVAKPQNYSRTYGSANPSLEIEYTGFIGADTQAALDVQPQINTTASPSSSVGSYAITLSGGDDANYTYTLLQGTLIVEKAELKATCNKTKSYGQSNPSLTIEYEGFVNNDQEAVLDAAPIVSTIVTNETSVGQYPITLTGGTDDNYSLVLEDGSFNIIKAILFAKASDKTKTYGSTNPTLAIEYNGFMNNDQEVMLDAAPVVSTTVTTETVAGEYPIIITGGIDDNYSIVLEDGSFTITKAFLVAKAADKTKTYGTTNPTLTIEYFGFVNGDQEDVLDVAPTISTAVTSETAAGEYPIVVISGTDSNYSLEVVNGTFTIEKASQVITFGTLEDRTLGDVPFLLAATSTSALPVLFSSSDPTVAQIATNVVTLLASGVVEIKAYQPGNENYLPAEDVVRTLHIAAVTALELASMEDLKIYPNPTAGKFYIDLQKSYDEFVVFDQTGNIVHHYANLSGSQRIEMDISSLLSGFYYVTGVSQKRSIGFKIVKF